MRSQNVALLWEIWRTKRGMIVVAVAMTLLGAYGRFTEATGAAAVAATSYDPDPALFFLLRILSLLLVFGICNYTESGDGRGFGGFPERLFTLPVSTPRLVALPVLVGIVAIEVHYLAWMDRSSSQFSGSAAFYGVILGATTVFYQVALWTLERLKSIKLIVLGVLGAVMIAVSQLPMVSFLDDSLWGSERFLLLLVSVLAAGAFLLGWGYVSRLRRGERGQPGSMLSPARLMDLLPGRNRGFRTPAGAQFWYEWRTLGVVYPLLVIGMLVFVIAPLSWLLRDVPDSPGKILILVIWTLSMPVMFAHPLGIAISRPSLWGEDLSVPLVSATKPLTAAELVAIRIRAATLGVAIAWLGVLVFLLVLPLWADISALTRFAADWQAFHQGSAASVWIAATLLFLAAMLLSWRFMISSLWIGLSGSKRLFNGLMVLLAAVPIAGLVFDVNRLPGWVLAEPARLTGLVWLTTAAVAAKYVLAIVGWRGVARRLVLQYQLIAVAGTVCFVLLWLAVRDLLTTFVPAFGLDQVQTFAILVTLLLVPLARPGFTPAVLARNRHRG